MKLKTILLFIVLFLFLAGCQTNKLGTDTQSGMSDENKLPTVNSAYPVNSATSNQSASPAAQKDSDIHIPWTTVVLGKTIHTR
jgi:hypothetical protein